MPIIDTAQKASSLALLLALPIAGCSTVGPVSIDQGRTPYNEVIQTTSEQQTLLNLVRASRAETPLFMDVTEVDAATSAQVNVSGTESGLGAILNRTSTAGTLAGSVGSVMAGAQYQEAPTVRYQPVLGAALVAQVATPVSATSLVNLYDSGWPLGSIFDLTVTRFTPGFDDYHAALNALLTLDRYGALVLEARTPEGARPTVPKDVKVQVSIGQQPAKEDADLVIHFRPERLRYRFAECDGFPPLAEGASERSRAAYETRIAYYAQNLWHRVLSLYPDGGSGRTLVLSTKAGRARGAGGKMEDVPLLRTRSALGMLNTVAAGDNLVRFAPREEVDALIDATAHDARVSSGEREAACHASFYRAGDLTPDGRDRDDKTDAQAYENHRFMSSPRLEKAALDGSELERERKFGGDRRLILVEVTGTRPPGAFASVFHRDAWYSIQDRDEISKRNLALVAQIATIQAVPPSTGPLTPTIAVGAR